ncbi:MAG: formylmethanofuran dehydrogenase subunit B, partial [Archaeoglobaceae archaeon]
MICTGCSCLCEDIEILDSKVLNACEKGYKHISGFRVPRTRNRVYGKEVDVDKAIESAIEILKSAKSAVIYGLDTTTLEAQRIAVKIAEKLQSYIDDNSSFCLGEFVEAILKKRIPSATLDEVRDYAYV